jgi:hypothetical protein
MRGVALTKVLTAASAVNIAAAQTLAASGNFTLTATPVTLDTQRRVLFTFSADETGHTFTIRGYNEGGGAICETIAGTTAGTVATKFDYLTITQASGPATTGNVSIGTNTVGSSRWVLFNALITPPALGVDMELVTGSGNASFEWTNDPFMMSSQDGTALVNLTAMTAPIPIAPTALANQSATVQGSLTIPIHAWRLTVNSGTGTWRATGIQAGLQ